MDVLFSFLDVLLSSLVLLDAQQALAQVRKAERVYLLELQRQFIVPYRLVVLFAAFIDVAEGVVGAVVAGIYPDALLEPKDGGFYVVFVVVGDAQAVVGVVVGWADFNALFVPFDGLVVIFELAVDAAESVVRMLVLVVDFDGLQVGLDCVVVFIDLEVGVSEAVVAAGVGGFGLDQLLEGFDALLDVLVAEGGHEFGVAVVGVDEEGFLGPLGGLGVPVEFEAVDEGDLDVGLVEVAVKGQYSFIQFLSLNELFIIILEMGQAHHESVVVGPRLQHVRVPEFGRVVVLLLLAGLVEAEDEGEDVVGGGGRAALLLLQVQPLLDLLVVKADAVFAAAQAQILVLQLLLHLDASLQGWDGLAVICTFEELLAFLPELQGLLSADGGLGLRDVMGLEGDGWQFLVGRQFDGGFGLGVFLLVVLLQGLLFVSEEGHGQGVGKIIYLLIMGSQFRGQLNKASQSSASAGGFLRAGYTQQKGRASLAAFALAFARGVLLGFGGRGAGVVETVFVEDDGGGEGFFEVFGEGVDDGLVDDGDEVGLGGEFGADEEDVLEFVVKFEFGDFGQLAVPVLFQLFRFDQVRFVHEHVHLLHFVLVLELLQHFSHVPKALARRFLRRHRHEHHSRSFVVQFGH